MAVDEKTNEALDLKTLKLPPFPPVARIEWEEYEDSTHLRSLRASKHRMIVAFREPKYVCTKHEAQKHEGQKHEGQKHEGQESIKKFKMILELGRKTN